MAGCVVAVDVGGTSADVCLAEEEKPTLTTEGELEIVNNTMASAMRAISIERGYDPRDFVLLACGGAGALHAGRLAELLEMPTVIIPRYAGVLSTLGLLHSDIKNDYVRTMLQRHNAFDLTALNTAFSDLEEQARYQVHLDRYGNYGSSTAPLTEETTHV